MSHSSDSFQNNYSQNKYKQNTLTLITNVLLAQVVEHWSCKPEVLGSTPKGGKYFIRCNSVSNKLILAYRFNVPSPPENHQFSRHFEKRFPRITSNIFCVPYTQHILVIWINHAYKLRTQIVPVL